MRIINLIRAISENVQILDSTDHKTIIEEIVFYRSFDREALYTFVHTKSGYVKLRFNEKELAIFTSYKTVLIPFEDLEQDDSYLVLKYGKTILDDILVS